MNPQNEGDELQEIWASQKEGEENSVNVQLLLLREKQRSLLDWLGGQALAEYMVSLTFVPLTGFAAWAAKTPLTGAGYALMSISFAVGALIVWLNQRATKARCRTELSVADYQRQLLETYDWQIRCLKGAKFWYLIPLLSGAGMVLFRAMPTFILIGGLAIVWAAISHFGGVSRTRQLYERRDEVVKLVEQLGRR